METAENQNAVVMVTGATGNLGRAVVRELAANGYRLVRVERNVEALERFSADCGLAGNMVRIGGIDLTELGACKEAVGRTLAAFGRIDALVNTVGGFETGPISEAGISQWDRLFQMDANTAYTISAAVLQPMREVGYGHIVHVSAAPGLKASANHAAYAAYAASKGAVIRLTEAIAGWVQPGEIAKLIGFLVSPAGGVVTVAAIPATGRI